ncbi:uncharacterized protein LOC116115659 [Pistacia vera]|uniref:uncharacterized protein LOC116115659 n=1 Tax=Pistacia vera TaxID=55513 RepID=UPI001262DF2B|nr:uncharacterized protein LOC116115659 [Pistacia vera]
MENRLDVVEKDMGTMRDCLLEIQAWIRRKDEEKVRRAERGGSTETPINNTGNIEGENEDPNANMNDENGIDGRRCPGYAGRKIEMLVFVGEDPYGWLFQIERYFNVYQVAKEEWLNTVARFGGSQDGGPYEALMGIRQTGTVDDYRRKFEALSAPLKDEKEDLLWAVFLNGLKPELKAESSRQWNERTSHFSLNASQRSSSNSVQQQPSSSVFRKEFPFKQMTELEIQRKKARGVCFRCDANFFPGHRCGDKQFHVVLIDEDESQDEPNDVGADLSENVEEQLPNDAELSISSIVGISSPKTMKVKGKISGAEVIVLIDSGASHNFISKGVIEKLGLPVMQTQTFGVRVGDGYQMRCEGECREVQLDIQGTPIIQNFFPFEMNSADVVLGVAWLETLGETTVDWKTQVMKFKLGDRIVKFVGDPSLSKTLISLKVMLRTIQREGHGCFVEFGNLQKLGESQVEEDSGILPVLVRYQSVFSSLPGLPPPRTQDHSINLLPGSQTPNIRPYRYPYYQKNEIEKLVSEMLAAGIIKPNLNPFSSPVLLVKKEDGGWRFCVDYRALNKITVPDKFPILVVDELFDELGGASIFSKLDLKSGYHQIRVKEGETHKTSFRTHEGHYEFLVMPFGLTNAPATFQALMNDIFRPFLRRFILVFFDDILVYSHTKEDHIRHLEITLSTLEEHHLVANKKKCFFGQRELEYLGHVISACGVAVDPSKIDSVLQWPSPKDIRALRGFLGLTGYYRRLVKDYGKIAIPLTSLLKKDAFQWNSEAQKAFDELKRIMTSVSVLALPDFTKEFIIETDASGSGLGAVLMQEGRPLAFLSKDLSSQSKLKSVYERELMAIVMAVQKWRHYLLGRRFIIRTDQRSLHFLTDQQLLGEDQQKWVAKLIGLNFIIQYKPGAENRVADALSRRGEQVEFDGLSVSYFVGMEELEDAIQQHDKLRGIVQKLLLDPNGHPPFTLVGHHLLCNGRLVVPRKGAHIPFLLHEFHSSPIGGHSGFFRTFKRLSSVVYWEGMKRDIKEFVDSCAVCQQNKYQALSPAGLLQPLSIPEQVWEDISMDFITGLPKTNSADTILVVVDRLTKYSHFLSLKHPYTATDVAHLFIKEIVWLHGFPLSIISDRDRVFISHFWKELFKHSGTQLRMSSAYHPQTDGQSEVVNRCVETYLHCFVSSQPRQWPKWISWAKFWFNTTFNGSTSMTRPGKTGGWAGLVATYWQQAFLWEVALSGVHELRVNVFEKVLQRGLAFFEDLQILCSSHWVTEAQAQWAAAQANLDWDPFSTKCISQERNLANQYFSLCRDEETFLKQWSRIQWLNLGDQNTKFFHKSLIHRQVRNRIHGLIDANGTYITDSRDLGRLVVRFFQGLLTAPYQPRVEKASRYFSRCISYGMISPLIAPIIDDEIRTTLFSISDDKAPGLNGCVNTTKIALVLKVEIPSHMIDFRPLAFVLRQRISDNILLTQELLRNYHLEGTSPRCALKVDIRKAFDIVSWDFIFFGLRTIGIPERMVDVSSVSHIKSTLDSFAKVSGLVTNVEKN